MALYGDRTARRPIFGAVVDVLRRARQVASGHWKKLADYVGPVWDRIAHLPIWAAIANSYPARLVGRSIHRRILVWNLFGLAILVLGWMLVTRQNTWLIDAKRDALKTQSRIVAAAVAARVRHPDASGLFDPDEVESAKLRSDLLDALDFKIRPELVAPVLARLISDTETRARIYVSDGTEILDSNDLVGSSGISILGVPPKNVYKKPKNFWTRFLKWRLANYLPVYQDIDDISGRSWPEIRATMKDGRPRSMLLVTESSEQVVANVVPIRRYGEIHGVLMLSTEPGAIDDLLSEERLRILVLALLATCATAIASIILARTVAGPLRHLSQAAEDVASDINASDGLPRFDERDDEVGQLARSFAQMTQTLRKRIDDSERFAADVAHELKNPLTAASSTASSLIYARDDAHRTQLIEQVNGELTRLNKLISDVASAQRLDAQLAKQENEPVPLDQIARNIVDVFRDIHAANGVNLVYVSELTPAQSRVFGHDGRLGQVLTNLIDNAVSFSPVGGTVTVRLDRVADTLRVAVEDQGKGVDPEQTDKIFRRFYTYRPSAESSRGDNSGLGLSITREIIQAHAGRIWVENRDEGGAKFVVELPAIVETNRRRNFRV